MAEVQGSGWKGLLCALFWSSPIDAPEKGTEQGFHPREGIRRAQGQASLALAQGVQGRASDQACSLGFSLSGQDRVTQGHLFDLSVP